MGERLDMAAFSRCARDPRAAPSGPSNAPATSPAFPPLPPRSMHLYSTWCNRETERLEMGRTQRDPCVHPAELQVHASVLGSGLRLMCVMASTSLAATFSASGQLPSGRDPTSSQPHSLPRAIPQPGNHLPNLAPYFARSDSSISRSLKLVAPSASMNRQYSPRATSMPRRTAWPCTKQLARYTASQT